MLESIRQPSPNSCQTVHASTPTITHDRPDGNGAGDNSSDEIRDSVDFNALPTLSRLNSWTTSRHHSHSSSEASPTQSRSSSPEPSHASSTAPCIHTADTAYTASAAGERPSVLSRLRSSISTTTSLLISSKVSVVPSDFLTLPEQPEKRFADSIGIVCPGVSDRQ